MYQTLEDLEIQAEYERLRNPKLSVKKVFGELKIVGVIFVMIFVCMYLVTNAQLLVDNIQDRISPQKVLKLQAENVHSSATLLSEQKQKLVQVEELMEKYAGVVSVEKEIAPKIDHVLRENLDTYEFAFNLLPPTNRLVIPSIHVDVPLIKTEVMDYEAFTAGSFDDELARWAVKYPTTPNPGEGGNAFFFGHTAQETRRYNKYGTVFRNIPSLAPGHLIQVVREGELYEYKVVTTEIVTPKQVNTTYMKYVDIGKEYITLMGCYPIGRTDKRIMVFAERIQ